MQTMPTRDGAALTGGVQTPLLTEDQLEPGVFLIGHTSQNTWKVYDVDLRAGTVQMRRQPETSLEPGHQHTFTLHQGTTCVCGQRQQVIRGDSGLLPLRANTPRVYIIKARDTLVMPDPFTVYLTATGVVIRARGGNWSTLLPLVPALHPVWTLPEPLRAMLREP